MLPRNNFCIKRQLQDNHEKKCVSSISVCLLTTMDIFVVEAGAFRLCVSTRSAEQKLPVVVEMSSMKEQERSESGRSS
jgi:hypothetical protein